MVRVSTAAAAGVEGGIEVELQLIHKHFFFFPIFSFYGSGQDPYLFFPAECCMFVRSRTMIIILYYLLSIPSVFLV